MSEQITGGVGPDRRPEEPGLPADAAGSGCGRRGFLRLVAATPLALPAAWALLACGGEEEHPAAGGAAPPSPEPGSSPTAGEPPAPPAAAPGGGSAADPDALVTEIEAMQPTVQALQYVNESQKPDQHCSNCQFYTAKTDARGRCQLFTQGLVTSQGWCASWVARVTT